MDIECEGCFYTICSFICLTEDLSETLQFLWRHGCLRRTYHCDKCGRKCAIGDKDLFFRCNRNVMYATEPQMIADAASSSLVSNGSRDLSTESRDYSAQINYQPNYQEPSTEIHRSRAQMHPALRLSVPLPGDPLPPSRPSLVFPLDHRHFLAESHGFRDGTVEQDRGSGLGFEKIEANEISGFPESELADLDAPTNSRKRVKKKPAYGISQKQRCNFKMSMKKGTIFEKSKLPIDTVCKFVVFWCCMKQPTQEFLRNELSLATRTVVDWSTTCREICVHWARQNSEKIGGVGVVVQVDQVKVALSSRPGPRHSFWGIEKEKDKGKGKLFVVPVESCDIWTLLHVLNEWVLPGSIVVSNCWKNFDCFEHKEFVRQTRLHGKTLVNPPTNGVCNFDGAETPVPGEHGIKPEDLQMPRFGTRRSHHLGDLAEFMFKRHFSNHLERMHAFFKQVAASYPLR